MNILKRLNDKPFLKKLYSIPRSYFILTRFILSVSVGFTGMVCFIKLNGCFNFHAFYIFIGIFFLAAGASALNQFQERSFDSRMKRTMKRPIPAGLISIPHALLISILLITCGLFILIFYGNQYAMFVGLFSILWYNFIYTYLKRITSYALFMGIFTGIGPVFIGWLAAGGGLFDKECLMIAIFMSIWQVPHFLLLMLLYEDDYRNAGFPILADNHSIDFVKTLIIISSITLVVIALILVYFNVIHLVLLQLLAVIVSLMFMVILIKTLLWKTNSYKYLLISVNSYMIIFMFCLFIDSILI